MVKGNTRVDFVHLHTHSYYSLLDATASPDALLKRANELGMKYLAITDHNALYGAVEFFRKAQTYNIQAIIGAEIEFCDVGKLLLLVTDSSGYKNLSALITEANFRGGHLNFKAEFKDLISKHQGLIILSGGQQGKLWRLIQERDMSAAQNYCKMMKNIFASNFFIEVQHYQDSDRLFNLRLRDLALSFGIGLCATNDIHFLHPGDWQLRRTLHAIDQNAMIDRVVSSGCPEQYLKGLEEMRESLSYLPEALENTGVIARNCKFCFNIGRPVFPSLDPIPGMTPAGQLRKAAFSGIRKRYTKPTRQLIRRLRKELRIIVEMGFADYFLIVKDIVDFCHVQNIPCVGRGSAGDSLISYLLGITQVDPLEYDLYFERFLNRERKDPPDIDLDIDWVRRDEVLNYVYDRFGRDKTAMICTFNTFQLRSSIRDVAKVYGFPEDEIKTMLRFLPRFGIRELALAVEKIPHCRQLRSNAEILQVVLKLAERISDFPRHLSIHAGGIIIAPQKITHYTPLEIAGKGLVISQMDMYSIEPLGLVKMDLLGVRSLSVISEAVRNLHAIFEKRELTPFHHPLTINHAKKPEAAQRNLFFTQNEAASGQKQSTGDNCYRLDLRNRKIVPEPREQYLNATRFPFLERVKNPYALLDTRSLPTKDIAVTQMLRAGLSMGCFQLESPGMRNLLAKMQITGVGDVIAAVALIRPGAADSGMKDIYIKRRSGLIAVEYPTPLLKPILEDTYGVIIYQEQVMQVAASVAKFSLAQGEFLRRAMTKFKKREKILQLRRHFVEGVIGNGQSPETAEAVWDFLKNFVGYGFNKAHAAIYGVIAYQSAYLKYYFPVPFMTAVLNNEGGFYHTAAYVEECRRLGMRILSPDVNSSAKVFTWRENAIRVGLKHVFELTNRTLNRIIDERRRSGPYLDYFDFVARVRPRQGEAETLIKIGALDSLNPNQPELLVQNNLFFKNKFHRTRTEAVSRTIQLTPYSPEQRIRNEIQFLGFAVTDHPLRLFESKLDIDELTPSYIMEKKRDQRVVSVGWRITSRRLRTRSDEYMQFLTLEDRYGLMEAIMFPGAFKKFGDQLQGPGPFRIEGIVQSRLPGEANLIIEKLRRLF